MAGIRPLYYRTIISPGGVPEWIAAIIYLTVVSYLILFRTTFF